MSIKAKACILTVFLLFLMISQSLSSQNIRVLSDISAESSKLEVRNLGSKTSLNLNLPAVALNDISLGGSNYKKLDLPVGEFITPSELAEDGKPDLPALTANIIIPDQAGVRLTVTYSGYDDLPNIELAPVQPSPSETPGASAVPFTIDLQTYARDAFYPGNLAEASDPQIMRDVRFVRIALYPAQYNPVQKVLRVYRDISVDISYDGEVINPKTVHHRYLSEGFYPIYKAMFANFDQAMDNVEVKRGGYVIICRPTLVDTVKAVAQWKHQKGYPVRIVPTTEIRPTGSPSKEQIKAFLDTAYASWEIPPEYVMIVGDRDHMFVVPDYPYIVGSNIYASDNKYACVDGSDYIPDIFIARMSVDSMSQARVALSKILKYEKYPLMRDPEHWIRGLSVAYVYYESSRLTTLWVRQLQLRHGFVRVDTVFDSGWRLPSLFNAGIGFIQYRGAGGTDGWAGPSMTSYDLLNLQDNQKLGVLSPLTCGTGDFGGECFGETWIRMGRSPDSLKGGPAFYGVSDHDTHTRWNNPIMVGYFFGIFEENVYHFAAAAVRGKLQDYWTFPRQTAPGGMIQQYFNTYNMLGDPELELRTKIPISINVTHLDTVALGTNSFNASVIDSAGNAISGAYVTLIKTIGTTEEVFSVDKTDESGNVTLIFDANTPGSMKLTVSGQNLIPYQTNVEIATSDLAVGLDSIYIDDDTDGFSHGDGDHLAAPGETIELNVSIKNFGTDISATNVSAQLESTDGNSVVYDGIRNYGNLAPGESRASEAPFVVYVNPAASDGQTVRQKLTIRDQNNDSWQTMIEFPVKAPKFAVTRAIIPEGDSLIGPGQTANLKIFLSNSGSLNAQGVTGIVTTDDDYANAVGSIANFGDISIGGSGDNSSSLVSITCDSTAFKGKKLNLTLHISTLSGSKSSIPFTLTVGRISSRDPVGPDSYGYYMYDRMDSAYAMMPTYQWVEISPDSGGQGTRLNYGSELDDKSVLVTLPFNMKYYGQDYGAMIVCINGFAALDTTPMDMQGNYWANFFNWPIPDPGNARGQISPFWDDLRIDGTHLGVYKWYDSVNHKFYIEWLKLTNTNTFQYETFQMVIMDPAYYPSLTGDSDILFIYRDVNNTDSGEGYASVGFESYDEQRGLEFTHDNYYAPGGATLIDGAVTLITTSTGRGSVRGSVDLDGSGQNGDAQIHASTGQRRISASDGRFFIKEVPPGTISLTAEALGYYPAYQESIQVVANQLIETETLHLTRCPIPSSLSASNNISNLIEVRWDTLTNPNLAGFNIYRSRWPNGDFSKLNDSPIQATSYSDIDLADTNLYWYYVSALFSEGNLTAESFGSTAGSGKALTITGLNDDITAPKKFFLSQNYPNPFNPSTTISYGLAVDSEVRIVVFNIMGQKVKNLVDQRQAAGYKQVVWDGKDESGRKVATGLYFYKIETANFTKTNKMLLLK